MIRRPRVSLSVLLVLYMALVVQRPLTAQSVNERAVRAVVDSFFAALEHERWQTAAGLIDLKRFEPYFAQRVASARSELPQREMTAEDLMANDSTLPRAVAEWQVAQMKKFSQQRSFGDVSYEFAGVRSQRELFALTVPDAVARWLEAQDFRTQIRESWRLMGCPLASLPPVLPATKRTVLAVALSNDSTAYVVQTDDRFGGDPMGMSGGERVMVVQRVGGRWLIEPRYDLMRPGNMGFGSSGCPGPRREK